MNMPTIAQVTDGPERQAYLALGLDAARRTLEVFGVPADRSDIAARVVLVHALQWHADDDTVGQLRDDILALIHRPDGPQS